VWGFSHPVRQLRFFDIAPINEIRDDLVMGELMKTNDTDGASAMPGHAPRPARSPWIMIL